MTSYTIGWEPGASVLDLVAALTAAGLPPVGVSESGTSLTVTFDRDLAPAEQDTARGIAADIRGALHTRDLSLTLAEYQALKSQLAEIRTLRQRTDPQWAALTAAQRDSALIAWCRDLTDVLRALLSD